jgi:hypothetical protein
LLKSYDLITFVNDITAALYMDVELKDRVKSNYVRENGMDLYDDYLGCRIDFVTNWILLIQGKATASFLTLFAK